MGCTLVFFGRRIKFQQAFIATLLLLTCIEIHRAAMTTRVDMLLTTFIVIGLYQLFRWEDRLELKGLPIIIPILLGCAVLTKGPVGVILPLFVFGAYLLMLRKYSLLTIFKSLLYIGVSSLFYLYCGISQPGNREEIISWMSYLPRTSDVSFIWTPRKSAMTWDMRTVPGTTL